MATAEQLALDAGSGGLQPLLQGFAGLSGHHRILQAMGEQHLQTFGPGAPAGMGIATAGDQCRQRQRRR